MFEINEEMLKQELNKSTQDFLKEEMENLQREAARSAAKRIASIFEKAKTRQDREVIELRQIRRQEAAQLKKLKELTRMAQYAEQGVGRGQLVCMVPLVKRVVWNEWNIYLERMGIPEEEWTHEVPENWQPESTNQPTEA